MREVDKEERQADDEDIKSDSGSDQLRQTERGRIGTRLRNLGEIIICSSVHIAPRGC